MTVLAVPNAAQALERASAVSSHGGSYKIKHSRLAATLCTLMEYYMKPAIGESESSTVLPPHYRLPLDESFYGLDAEESAFFKSQTGIQDDNELKNHLLEIQAAAYAVHPYPCIRRFAWTKLKISRLPAYPHFSKLAKEREGAIYLDIGCCFGNDARKSVADGWPAENVVTFDLHQEFWDLGHKLFKSTPETFPATFIQGDAFKAEHLAIAPPLPSGAPAPVSRPTLSTLTSLNPLRGHISAIHASAFFHLFQEDSQLHLARALGGLLSPEPGSIILGSHGALPEKGHRSSKVHGPTGMFCHSPETWTALWDGEVFEKGTVRVETELVMVERADFQKSLGLEGDAKFHILKYAIIRL